ncbi:MAG: Uma2 family endonuclease [Cyanobacteria bacterium P01_G01_bin.54]
MIASPTTQHLSPETYLAQEEESPVKREYRDGIVYELYSMAGASDAHVTIAGNLFAHLRNHVRGTGCRAYMADMKARIEAANCYYYPDVMVTCDERDRELKQFKKSPCLIVEVLSPGTEANDRGDKFFDYQQLETLQEYVLVSQTQQRVDCFRRDASGKLWVLEFYTPGDEIHLKSIDCKISFETLYEDVVFEN